MSIDFIAKYFKGPTVKETKPYGVNSLITDDPKGPLKALRTKIRGLKVHGSVGESTFEARVFKNRVKVKVDGATFRVRTDKNGNLVVKQPLHQKFSLTQKVFNPEDVDNHVVLSLSPENKNGQGTLSFPSWEVVDPKTPGALASLDEVKNQTVPSKVMHAGGVAGAVDHLRQAGVFKK
jgi:hypothetical protein